MPKITGLQQLFLPDFSGGYKSSSQDRKCLTINHFPKELKPCKTFIFNQNPEDENQKRWKKEAASSSAKNSSTLSLHIAAYEKSQDKTVLQNVEKQKLVIEKQKLVIEKAEEPIPRQQELITKKSEKIGFKQSQKLLNLHSSNCGIVFSHPKITAEALSAAIKNADPYGLCNVVKEQVHYSLHTPGFGSDEAEQWGPLLFNELAEYLLRCRERIPVYMLRSSEESDGDESAISHRVYSGRLGRLDVLEILDKYRKGKLAEGSTVHHIFSTLVYLNTSIEAATICNKCKKIFASSASARSSHSAHKKWHEENEEGETFVPVTFKYLLIDCIADMISQDVVPYRIIEKDGFTNVLNTVFKSAFEYGLENGINGNIPARTPDIFEHLPSRNTLKNHVGDKVRALTPEFSKYVKHHIETYGGAVSFDFTDKNSPYYVVTIHFITKDWQLEHWSLEFGEFLGPNSNASTVLKEFLSIMERHGISEETVKKQIVICTDRGTNMISAFHGYNRIDDVCHQLSILSKRTVDPYKNNWLPDEVHLPNNVRATLANMTKYLKNATTLIKAINSRSKLKKLLAESDIYLAAHHEIRWLSRFRSIKSLLKLFDEEFDELRESVFDVLYEHKLNGQYIYREALNNVVENAGYLKSYVELLRPIKNAVKILESENEPTINQILVQYQIIDEAFDEALESEDTVIQHMASGGKAALAYQKTIYSSFSDYHTLGLLLDPLQKDKLADIVGVENLLEPMQLLKRYIRKYEDGEEEENEEDDPMEPSPYASFTNANVDPIDVEVDSYLKINSAAVRRQYANVLDFWRDKEEKYPKVAKLARRILPITSSAASERVFSLLGLTLTPCRMIMSPSSVSDLINLKTLQRFKREKLSD